MMEVVLQDIFKFFIAIISVLNPIGIVPTFVSMSDGLTPEDIKKIAKACSITVFSTIIGAMFLGEMILNFFSISIASFRVGGGLLIGSMAFQMLQGRQNKRAKLNSGEQEALSNEDLKEMGIVPLGIPLLSGPGTISTAIIYSNNIHGIYRWVGCISSILIASLSVYLVLILSKRISLRVGRLGLNVMTRIMGLILMALAVESIAAGLKVLLFS